MESIKSKTFEKFKFDELKHAELVMGGVSTRTQVCTGSPIETDARKEWNSKPEGFERDVSYPWVLNDFDPWRECPKILSRPATIHSAIRRKVFSIASNLSNIIDAS